MSQIPDNEISLEDAYAQTFDALFPNLNELEQAIEDSELLMIEVSEVDNAASSRRFEAQEKVNRALEDWNQAQQVAHRFLRESLAAGETKAYVREPKSGNPVLLPALGWDLPDWCEATFISSNLVSPNDLDNPGPAAASINGIRLPVFFLSNEFDLWFAKKFGSGSTRRRGRPTGSGSFADKDMPLIQEMNKMLISGDVKSIWEAAGKVASSKKAIGASEPSKQRRLHNLYRKVHLDR